jgi:hypothetical protein
LQHQDGSARHRRVDIAIQQPKKKSNQNSSKIVAEAKVITPHPRNNHNDDSQILIPNWLE